MTRDQERAVLAYRLVSPMAEGDAEARKNYKIAVLGLGANILRSGLAAAMAELERREKTSALLRGQGETDEQWHVRRAKFLREHLVRFHIPVLLQSQNQAVTAETLPAAVRDLGLGDYMLATRKMLQVVIWLKRAVQATFPNEESADAQSPS